MEEPRTESSEHKHKSKKRHERRDSDRDDLGWRQHRRIVEDVSDSLAKNWTFKIQVCLIVVIISATVISLVTLIIGGRIIDSQIEIAESGLTNRITSLSKDVDTKLKKVDQQVDEVRGHVEDRITKEFEQPQIRQTVENVARTAAAKIIADQVTPAEKTVTERLGNFEAFLEKRKEEYNADLSTFRSELEVLKKRNELTRLADQAIGDRSLPAYQRLSKVLDNETDENMRNAEMAEKYRVYQAYSLFAPSRALAMTFIVPKINPLKKEEAELSTDELIEQLHSADGLSRARAAILLTKKPITFQIADAVGTVIENEKDLEALRFEKGLIHRLPGVGELSGDLDGAGDAKWFKENRERLQKEMPSK